MKARLRSFVGRCAGLFRRRRLEAQMAEEMRAHLEVLTEEYLAAGMSPTDARLAARKRFGGVAQLEEQCRDEQRFIWMEQIGKDIGFAVKSLNRARSYAFNVLTMLVLGIGIATLVFDLTAWILIFEQPYPHPEQLFLVGFKDKRSSSNPYRPAMVYHAYREQTNVFSEYAVVSRDVGNVVIDGEPVVANLINTSIDCFRTLGITPRLGRGFLPDEYRPGARNVVIVTYAFWRKYLLGSPDVLGRKLLVDQQPCTVIGVLAPNQPFPPAFEGDVYRPTTFEVDLEYPLSPAVFIIGRLASGVPPETARAALITVKLPTLPGWAAAYLGEQEPQMMRITELARPETYWVMAIAAGLLYGIACLNVTNLTLLRLLGRRRELSIRLALGGTRWQIAQLLIVESAGLTIVASLLVMAAVRWIFPHIFALLSGSEAANYPATLNLRTAGCVALLTLVASIAGAFVPVWQLLKSEINVGLKEDVSAGGGRRLARMRGALVVLQAALAVILLAGTGLMVRSFERLHQLSLGFDPAGRVKVGISFPHDYVLKPEVRLQLFERLQQKLATLPGVRHASFGQDSLLIGSFAGTAQVLTPDGTYQSVVGTFVDSDYLKTAGMVLKKGRWLSGKRGDGEAVINVTMAKTLFGDKDPIGRTFKLLVSGDYNINVVGLVADVKQTVRSNPGMQFYWPAWAYPMNLDTVVLQLDRSPGKEFAGLVRHAIYQFDPKLIANRVSTIDEIVDSGMWAERYAFRILKMLTMVALGLAVVGLFTVVAYTVETRTKEFGVRMALGARPASLHQLVLRRGLTTAAVGIAIGVTGALGLTRFMQSLLFETTSYDPLVYAAVAMVLLLAAVMACWIPARRAARVDVAKLLRTE